MAVFSMSTDYHILPPSVTCFCYNSVCIEQFHGGATGEIIQLGIWKRISDLYNQNLFHFEAFPFKKINLWYRSIWEASPYGRRSAYSVLWKLGLSLSPTSLQFPGHPLPNSKSSWKQIILVVAWESKHFWSWEWTHNVLTIANHLVFFYLVPGYYIVSKGYFVLLHWHPDRRDPAAWSANFIFLATNMGTYIQNHLDPQQPLVYW